MTEARDQVRPTRRCLADLEIEPPNLGVRLHEIKHPLIMKAQHTAERERAGGAERIKSLTDRTWLKVKSSSWRGAAGRVAPMLDTVLCEWWLVAAGPRAADSAQHDFYAKLETSAHALGARTCSTDFLLPAEWDAKRLAAEAAVLATRLLEMLVRTAAGDSLLNADVRGFQIGKRDVRVRISLLADGQFYLAIGATGNTDVSFMTALFASIPGLAGDDWMPEPSDVLGFEPMPGEIMWSAMITSETQRELLSYAERGW